MKYTLRVTITKPIGNVFQYFDHRYHLDAENDADAKEKAKHALAILSKQGNRVVFHRIFKNTGWHAEEVK